MRKLVKRGAAVVLAALLAAPVQPPASVYGAEAQVSEGAGKAELQPSSGVHAPSEAKGKEDGGEKTEQGQRENVASPDNAVSVRTEESAKESSAEKSWREEVRFNTGNYEICVVDRETFEEGEGDAFFAEDGSYTINIPENNPFFPYEVQFTGEDGTGSRWFMTPEDSVEIDGHEFFVSAYFDGTAVTQMSLDVAGDTVVVYPEEKEFTDGDGAESMSLLPLVERELTVDFSQYTPVELTHVSINSVFTGESELKNTDKVIWTYGMYNDDYTVSQSGEVLDLSYGTSNPSFIDGDPYVSWQMIVGDDDQLAAENIRYNVKIMVTESRDWLTPAVYKQDGEGKRTELPVLKNSRYYDYPSRDMERELYIYAPSEDMDSSDTSYVGLKVNEAVFGALPYSSMSVYSGRYTDSEKAETEGKDITEQIFAEDMTKEDAGFLPENSREFWITMVTYDASGNAKGCLPIRLHSYSHRNHVSFGSLFTWKEFSGSSKHKVYISQAQRTEYADSGERTHIYTLDYGYAADTKCCLYLLYWQEGEMDSSAVTAAYAGKYPSIEAATTAGAVDISRELFDDEKGYEADYSKGVYFTIFVGNDDSEGQEVYQYCIKTEEGEMDLSDNTSVSFSGFWDGSGKYVNCYHVDRKEDSYGDYSYLTFMVESDVDLTSLAPIFYIQEENLKLYGPSRDGSGTEVQISGEMIHDFSKGPVQFTAGSESQEAQKNYWIQVIKPEAGAGKLYINSLADQASKTSIDESGTVHTTREIILDSRYDHQHDILLVNKGTEKLEKLSAQLESPVVELDSYWTLKGEYPLEGFSTVDEKDSEGNYSYYGELPNMAKLRVVAKEGVEAGSDISGTLTIKSGDKTLMVMTLTGTIGDPCITTKEVPEAVKYVPYGSMIQNNNKYEWNKVSYRLAEGTLPSGMTVKPNGELYGVPGETGEFTFTIVMENSHREFEDSERTFTLTVLENTNANVEAATDEGYQLTSRVQDMAMSSNTDQLLVSEGIYAEFVDLYLDGEKLEDGVDYTSESGSTRITIKSQTLKRSNTTGTHTLGIEFRTKDTDTLKRAAQNYEIRSQGSSGGNNSGGSGNGGSSSGGSSGSSSGSGGSKNSGSVSNTPSVTTDSKKGYVNSVTGIITGEGEGYSRWLQEENGWKLIYADGTMAAGAAAQLESGDTAEQVLWEQVNGSWYAFGADGYVKSGWVYDYQLGSWYLTTVDSGMQSGWYTDPQDTCTYYLEPGTGKLAAGWKMIDGTWYYFQAVSQAPTWELNRETGNWFYNAGIAGRPFGSMYRDERTPDGYVVDGEGRWNEESKQ